MCLFWIYIAVAGLMLIPVQAQPTIDNAPIVANVYEEQNTAVTLAQIECSPLASIKVTLVSITFGPCSTCFQIYQFSPTQHFELRFLPSQGTLSYALQQTYDINATCTDLTNTVFTIINVRVRTNEPPTFTGASAVQINANAISLKNGDVVHTITDAIDPDGDAVFFSMTVQPVTSAYKYEIGLTDGVIRAKADLASECFPTLVLFIYIRDNRSIIVGPKVVTVQFTSYYTVPYISTLNKQIIVAEDFPVATSNLEQVNAQHNSPMVTYSLETVPATAVSLFVIDSVANPAQLRLQQSLNFEGGVTQINVTIRPQNTFCTPDSFYLYIIVTNANDNPVLSPRDVVDFIYEGNVNFQPGFSYTDEDPGDTSTYSITAGDTVNFYIDTTTGAIQSNNYDIDGSNPTQVVFTIEITDSQGGTDSTSVTLNFLDANDNAPMFSGASFATTVEDCTPIGTNLGTIGLSDAVDTAFNDNNVCECTPATNGFINVLTTCAILLNASIPANSISTLYISGTDRGLFPGPRSTGSPIPFVVTSIPCSITTTTTPIPTTTTEPTSPATTIPVSTVFGLNSLIPATAFNGNNGTGNMPWIVIGCVIGCLGLAATAFVVSRYVAPRCRNNGSTPTTRKTSPFRSTTERNNTKPITPREVKPYEPRQGPDAYRNGGQPGPSLNQQNVWRDGHPTRPDI